MCFVILYSCTLKYTQMYCIVPCLYSRKEVLFCSLGLTSGKVCIRLLPKPEDQVVGSADLKILPFASTLLMA